MWQQCQAPPSPMGSTRRVYVCAVMLWDLTTLKTRTHRKPIVEQNSMCQDVSAIG